MISIDNFLRYNRQMMLPEIGEEGQGKILNARVLVIGAGGLGCPVLQYLSAAGVGTIGIVDFDVVELHNLHRQILYSKQQVGLSKVLSAKTVLEQLNPAVEYIVFDEKLTPQNCNSILVNFDIIIDGSDNFSTRYLINDTCVNISKPLIYGSIFKFEGQIAVFNHNEGKNLRDLFPEPPNPDDVPNCSLNGVLGTLPGIMGTLMAHEALKLIVGLKVLHNEIVLFDTLNINFSKLNF